MRHHTHRRSPASLVALASLAALAVACAGCMSGGGEDRATGDLLVGSWKSRDGASELTFYHSGVYQRSRGPTTYEGNWSAEKKTLKVQPTHVTLPSGERLDVRDLMPRKTLQLVSVRPEVLQVNWDGQTETFFKLAQISESE